MSALFYEEIGGKKNAKNPNCIFWTNDLKILENQNLLSLKKLAINSQRICLAYKRAGIAFGMGVQLRCLMMGLKSETQMQPLL